MPPRILLAITMAVVVFGIAFAQSPVAGPTFEVASIKPAKPLTPAMIASGQAHSIIDDAVFDVSPISMMGLITMAYRTKSDWVSGPGWMEEQRFSVAAKLPAGASRSQVSSMLQRMLAERFNLAAHNEQKVRAVYLLEIAKQGANLRQAALDTEPGSKGCQGRPGHTVCRSVNMAQLADSLMLRAKMASLAGPASDDALRDIDLPVVDQTGLSGFYDFDLEWNAPARADGGRGGAVKAASASTKATSIFEALQAVGLRLEKGKHEFDILVVDNVARAPTEN